ncbi:MAG: hypothetical protein KDK36_06660 [Leptospiraceae bacterium]|nr:hypothetical protein [Leptospiraceae bacterium]
MILIINYFFLKSNFRLIKLFINSVLIFLLFISCNLPKENCDENGVCTEEATMRDSLLLYLISTNVSTAKVKLKSPEDLGIVTLTIFQNKISANPLETSATSTPVFLASGTYEIESSLTGFILQNSSFNFAGNIRDGSILRETSYLLANKCYLIDGSAGKLVEVVDCSGF